MRLFLDQHQAAVRRFYGATDTGCAAGAGTAPPVAARPEATPSGAALMKRRRTGS